MRMTLVIVMNGLIVALFLVLGALFLQGKGAMFISGYNTMSESERNAIDEKRLCRFMGKFMLALAGLWLAITILEACQLKRWLWIGVGMFIVVTIGAVIYANTGNRFRK